MCKKKNDIPLPILPLITYNDSLKFDRDDSDVSYDRVLMIS